MSAPVGIFETRTPRRGGGAGVVLCLARPYEIITVIVFTRVTMQMNNEAPVYVGSSRVETNKSRRFDPIAGKENKRILTRSLDANGRLIFAASIRLMNDGQMKRRSVSGAARFIDDHAMCITIKRAAVGSERSINCTCKPDVQRQLVTWKTRCYHLRSAAKSSWFCCA